MKIKTLKFTVLFTLMLVLSAITSCISDDYSECDCNEKQLTMRLAFSKSNVNGQTRATEDGNEDGDFNENKLTSLNIFFYKGDVLKWKVLNADLNYDAATNNTVIPIRTNILPLFTNNTTNTYQVYVVANSAADFSSIAEGASNLQALKDLVFQSGEFVTKGGSEAQTSFVMDGVISQIININNPDLGTVDLKRAASKIRLRVVSINVPGHEQDGTPTARLVHFTDKSALLTGGVAPTLSADDWKATQAKPLSKTGALGGGTTTQAPFYAYANDWQTDDTRETYLELYVPLKDNKSGKTEIYRYRVPVTPQNLTGEQAQYMNNLTRNYLYDIAVTIKILGSVDEPPVEVTGNYEILDWTTQEILVDVKGAHYLVVSEREVAMPNISAYTLTFNSSVANVTLVPGSLKATFTYVNYATGQPVTENVSASQMPTVTVQPNVASGNINISSPIPTNYIPKDIEFKITNGQTGMIETVVIKQLSATYFTTTKGVRSYMPGDGWRNSLPSGNTNPYMYAVTTLAPTGNIIWGFPPVDGQGQTLNNSEVSNMVSPKFEMASQFGASPTKSYDNGQTQCRGYKEVYKDENGNDVEKTGWRLPTAAEIKYIDNLQQTAPSGYVMEGRYYWSSWSQYPTQRLRGNNWSGYYFEDNFGAYRMGRGIFDDADVFVTKYSGNANYNSAHVRCIRDIKD